MAGHLRFPRSTREAFAHERAPAIERYLSMKARHRLARAVRRFVAWLMGERP